MRQQHHQQTSASRLLPSPGISIGELSKQTGCATKTIRFYEETGILPCSARGDNGYRRYSQADVNRLHLLRRLRLLGISLAEAKSVLVSTLDAPCREVHHQLFDLIDTRLAALDQEIAELHQLREEVAGYHQQLLSQPVDKEEPFTTCYDQACLACSPAPALPLSPVGLLPSRPAVHRGTRRGSAPQDGRAERQGTRHPAEGAGRRCPM